VSEIVNRQTGELLDTDSIPGLAEVAGLHHEQLEELVDVIKELLADRDDAGVSDSRGPVVWHQLSPVESARAWRGLAEWVGWLRGRYPLAHQVPLCWWRHPELVEELTALWLAWRDAYTEKGASLTAAADWHGRWLPELLRRVGAGGWNLACEGEHRPRVSGLYDARQVDDQDQFTTFISGVAPLEARPINDGGNEMQHTLMQEKIDTGEARTLGELPGSPVAFAQIYWMRDGERWLPVESKDTIDYLSDAERRLALAAGDTEAPSS